MHLSLTLHLLDYSLWARDIVFVISDGHLDGMQAWVSAYHNSIQSSKFIIRCFVQLIHSPSDMHADHLTLSSGVIWTALNIDYPGHSFSHLGIFFGSFLSNLK